MHKQQEREKEKLAVWEFQVKSYAIHMLELRLKLQRPRKEEWKEWNIMLCVIKKKEKKEKIYKISQERILYLLVRYFVVKWHTSKLDSPIICQLTTILVINWSLLTSFFFSPSWQCYPQEVDCSLSSLLRSFSLCPILSLTQSLFFL